MFLRRHNLFFDNLAFQYWEKVRFPTEMCSMQYESQSGGFVLLLSLCCMQFEFSYNPIGMNGAKVLADTLKFHGKIETLRLGWCQVYLSVWRTLCTVHLATYVSSSTVNNLVPTATEVKLRSECLSLIIVQLVIFVLLFLYFPAA